MSKFHKSNNSVPAASSAAIFYGRHPVAAAIANPRRQINKILCTAENAEELRRLCTENRRTPGLVNIVDRKEIDRILPREAVHQGIAVMSGNWKTTRWKISALWPATAPTAMF